MSDLEEIRDALERTVLEIDAMSCIFCNDFTEGETDGEEFNIITKEPLERVRSIIDSDDPIPELSNIPQIDVEVFIKCTSDRHTGCIQLRISLHPGYPSVRHAEVSVLSTPKLISNKDQDQLSNVLKSQAVSLLGSEAMMEIVNLCREEIDNWEDVVDDKLSYQEVADVGNDVSAPDDSDTTIEIKRCWIWVHHITNSGRLKQIVVEAQQLNLGGYLKGGYPGVVVVEGKSALCDEFVTWIKGNKSRPGGFGRNWGTSRKGRGDKCFHETITRIIYRAGR